MMAWTDEARAAAAASRAAKAKHPAKGPGKRTLKSIQLTANSPNAKMMSPATLKMALAKQANINYHAKQIKARSSKK